MTRRMLGVLGLTLVLAAPGLARAGEVHLVIKDGRVALVARDATLREILVEWERVGGTRIVNRDRVPGTRLDLEFADVAEEQALTTLLRPIAGYMASRRLAPEAGASAFSRIVLMPALASPTAYASAGPVQSGGPSGPGTPPGMGGPTFGRPGMQRRVLPDGRVVTVMDDPQPVDEPDVAEDERPGRTPPGMMRQPGNMPPRGQQDPPDGDAQQNYPPPGQTAPTLSPAPTLPQQTVGTPGMLPAKPGAIPPPPIKPPGD